MGTVALDTETNDEGLRADRGSSWPWRGGYMLRHQRRLARGRRDACRSTFRCAIPTPTISIPTQVYRWLKDLVASDVRIVTQNGIYDCGWLRADGGVVMPPSDRLEEIGALATMIDENQFSYSLDSLVRALRPARQGRDAVAAGGRGRGLRQGARRSIRRSTSGGCRRAMSAHTPRPTRSIRCCCLRSSTRSWIRRISAAPIGSKSTCCRWCWRCAAAAFASIRTPPSRRAICCCGKRDAALAKLSEQLGAPVGMDEINGRKWKEKTFEQYGIPFPRTEKGNPIFSAGKSGWMATHPHWLPQRIAIANKYEAAGTKFLEGHILKHIVGGRIHAEIHPFRADDGGTRSSRFSYSNPPLQQMPVRDKELGPLIRSVFLPEEGEIWASPTAQQEFRWLVDYAAKLGLPGSEEAVATYRDNPDADFHAMVAEMTGLDRDAAKSVNFAKSYGAGVQKLAEMIGKPVAETRAIVIPSMIASCRSSRNSRWSPGDGGQASAIPSCMTARAGTGINTGGPGSTDQGRRPVRHRGSGAPQSRSQACLVWSWLSAPRPTPR